MRRHAPARAALLTTVALAALSGVAACAASGAASGGRSTSPPGGDPGNRMLHQLATDPIFNTLPPGATRISLTKTPAKYRKTPFQGEGWDGPSVVLHFTSSAPVLDVYRHYAQLAARAQWAPGGKGSLGVTMDWSIDYPNAHAQVVLFLDNQHDTALPRGYSLRGSIGSRAASSAPTTGHTG